MQPIFARGNQRTCQNLLRWQQQAETDKVPRVVLRLQAVRLSVQGHTAPDIARLLGVERSSVYDWICAWNDHQLEGLKEGQRSGRPARLTAAQREHIFDLVESGPIAYGFTTGVWTSPLLQHVIVEEFGVSYHPGHVRKLLKTLGCSVQRPTTRLVQADPRAQNKWVRFTYPNLKKKPTAKEA
jgi:transposase